MDIVKLLSGDRIWRNKTIVILFGLNVLVNLFLWLFIYFQLRHVSGPIPLHYNVIFGVDVIGSWQRLFFVPWLGLIIFLLNYVLSSLAYQKRERMISFFLLTTSLLVQGFLTLAILSIVNL